MHIKEDWVIDPGVGLRSLSALLVLLCNSAVNNTSIKPKGKPEEIDKSPYLSS